MLENQKGSSRWTYIIRNPWNSSDWMEMGNLQPIMSFFFINRYSLRAGSKSGQADRGRGSGTVLSMMERGATQVEPRRLCKISTPKLCQAIHRRNIWPFSPPNLPEPPQKQWVGSLGPERKDSASVTTDITWRGESKSSYTPALPGSAHSPLSTMNDDKHSIHKQTNRESQSQNAHTIRIRYHFLSLWEKATRINH